MYNVHYGKSTAPFETVDASIKRSLERARKVDRGEPLPSKINMISEVETQFVSLDTGTDKKGCAYAVNLLLYQGRDLVPSAHTLLRGSCCGAVGRFSTPPGEAQRTGRITAMRPRRLAWDVWPPLLTAATGGYKRSLACFLQRRAGSSRALCWSQVAYVHAEVLPFILPHDQRAHFQVTLLVKLSRRIFTDVRFLRPEVALIPSTANRLSSVLRKTYCPKQSNKGHVFHDRIITYFL